MPDKDDLDLLLDSALATYADPGRNPGLEQRVLSALAAERSVAQRSRTFAPSRRWLVWAILAPVAVSVLLWIGTSRTRRPQPMQTPQAQVPERPQVPPSRIPITADQASVRSESRPSRATAHVHNAQVTARVESCAPNSTSTGNCAALPKLAVFPHPQPLTAEEQALVAAATRNQAEREALLAAQKQFDTPLSIATLNIPPLAAPDEGKN